MKRHRIDSLAPLSGALAWVGALVGLALQVPGFTQERPGSQAVMVEPAVLAELESHLAVTFARYGDRELQLDLYRPKERGRPLPAILCLHGGGWYKGDRSSMTNLAQALAGHGFVALSVSYRLSGEAKFPAAMQDVKAAVRWLRSRADHYGVQSDQIGVVGMSAGGHLAALLATSGGVAELEGSGGHAEQSSAIQACVAIGAQADLETGRIADLSAEPNDPFYRTFLGAPLAKIPQTYALASPRHHLDANDPPILFMAGEKDDPSTHADEVRAELAKLQIPTGLVIVPGAPHGFLGQRSWFDQAVRESVAFFTQHFRIESR